MASESDNDLVDTDDEDIRATVSETINSRSANASVISETVARELHQTGVPVIQKDWLIPPEKYMKPLLMCAVNQYVHCVDSLDSRYLSHGAEYVLVGTGTSMPPHFHWWIFCMQKVNALQPINGCAVPVRDTTRLLRVAKPGKGKQYDVIGIERRITHEGPVEASHQTKWIKTTAKNKTFMAKCSEQAADPDKVTFARVNNVELHWGLIPVEYMEDGVLHRKVFHVLRTIPAPGLNLRDLIQKKFFDQRNNPNKKNAAIISEVCDLLDRVVNYEADTNLQKQRMWGGPLPNPWALTDPSSATSVERLLSPFILPKLLNHLNGGHCGMDKLESGLDQSTLLISGFPDLRTPESAQAAIDFYERREDQYLDAVKDQELAFNLGLAKYNKSDEEEADLEPILCRNGVNYNCLLPDLNLVFYLKEWLLPEAFYKEAEKLTLPKLAMALIDLFQFASLDRNLVYSKENFIVAHVGENNEIVTETSIYKKYKVTDAQSLGDFPRAGMYGDRRKVYKLNAEHVRNPDVVTQDMVQLYRDYMRLQLTTTWNGFEMDAWMSDRVHQCAQCVQRLSGDMCDKVGSALHWTTKDLSMEATTSMQTIVHDEVSYTWARLNLGLCKFNETGKANPLNLGTIWAMLGSDVLTFLGLHNESWRWVMFPIMIAPGMGHLRAQTEDGHSVRTECVFIAKPNGAGLDEVVIKIVTWFFTMVDQLLPDLLPEVLQALRMVKIDRMTRPAVEDANSVQRSEGKIFTQPMSTDFMKALYTDEFNRQLDEPALQGLVTTALPRDSMAGEGATFKSQESKTRGPREKGCNQQLPGMGMYLLVMGSNTNPQTSKAGEAILTLIRGAISVYPPGAQQSSGMSKLLDRELKRKRGEETGGSMTTGDASLPTDPNERKHVSYLYCVLMMVCRHIGLINKTAQSNWEISVPLRDYIDNFKQRYFTYFGWAISQTLDQNNDRIMKGFVARAVSSCLVCTVATQMEQFSVLKEACLHSLFCMESSALTLYWANMALLNGISHLSDAGLCTVNQIIRFKLESPVLNIDFLCSMLDAEANVDRTCADFEELRAFLEKLSDQYVAGGFTGSYALVQGVGSNGDYAQLEHYLQKFVGINHGSSYTYRKMFHQAANKIINLTEFLDLSESMLDVRGLFRRCGVRYENDWYNTPGDKQQSGNRYVILVADHADKLGTYTVGKVFVHVVQHLLVSALIGKCDLHSDNSFEFGKNLFSFLVRRTAPQQAVPSSALMCESFKYRYGKVTEDLFPVISRRDYFLRKRKCYHAWREGAVGQMGSVIGAHPLEDVMHIHAWVQLHIMHCGTRPKTFYHMPGLAPRGAELVPGRIYPVLGPEEIGVICVCPQGLSFVLLQIEDGDSLALPLDRWQQALQIRDLSVGPLVFRRHAVVVTEDLGLAVLQEQDELVGRSAELAGFKPQYNTVIHNTEKRNFLDCDGNYVLLNEEGTFPMPWQEVHCRLLALGTHIAVLKMHLRLTNHSFPRGNESYVVGWLRYPDACDEGGGHNDCVYVAFRVATRPQDFDDVVVKPIQIQFCVPVLHRKLNLDDTVDYLEPRRV